jgi:MerR family copper efflux transcriptional regulator
MEGDPMSQLVIGEVARQTGVSAKTIRYYEGTGLIPSARRAANGYRVYDAHAVHLLRFVKRARDLGFSMEDVGSLLALWADEARSSAEVKALATQHLRDIERKISELQSLQKTMGTLIAGCSGDGRPDCPILEELAAIDHEHDKGHAS